MIKVWSDIDSNIIKDSKGDIAIAYDVNAVMSSIDNILRTSQGERCMLSSFASNISNLLFEPIHSSMLDILARQVKECIDRWEPRVIINAVNFSAKSDDNEIDIVVSFAIRGYQETFQYVPPFKVIIDE